MKNFILISISLAALVSCEALTNAHTDSIENKVYKIHLNPSINSNYTYDITSETNIRLEVNDQKILNTNKSDIDLSYNISRDTSGNFLFSTHYDKLHLYTKSADKETELDAANGPASINPVERMLAILKDATIDAIVSSSGEVKHISGFEQVGEKIIAGFDPTDIQSKNVARSQWDKLIGEGLIKRNMNELFRMFPDSAVHIGQRWKLDTHQEGELPMQVKAFYRLDAITDGVAQISSEAVLQSDSGASSIMGQQVMAQLKGKQEGEYRIDIKTGMLKSSQVSYQVTGVLELMGREVPVSIESETNVHERKH